MFNPLNLLKKKKEGETEAKKEENEETSEGDESDEDDSSKKESKKSSSDDSTNPSLIAITTELDRVKASVESFSEVRKALGDRMEGLSQQTGELRAMIMDRDRTIQELELKAVKAADLVESVQPDKLMIEVQKEDAKFEALKANLEGNEAIMDRIMQELKEVRKKLDFFRGVEEVISLSQEVKKELVEIKKVEAGIQINTDKVLTIYAEMKKKFQDIDLFKQSIEELKANVSQNTKDADSIKNKMLDVVDKQELDKVVAKVQKYIDALKEINKKTSLSKDVADLKSMLEGL